MSHKDEDTFITVVSVSAEMKTQHHTPIKGSTKSEYITVLTINNEDTKSITDVTEEVVVYRLPGERLGFGLKFEGGTKAQECVKRLFIQSCAPDSPASRVESSWGKLEEGDEVLEIDSVPVNNMTRIDCVRCLKESNMTIKLLVRHCFISTPKQNFSVVINTEERKPPLVPPRKHHRKLLKNTQNNDINHENIIPIFKQDSLSCKTSRLQSPRNSFRKKYSPDLTRRLSDVSFGPPDAEVYLDLISQESTQSLSESDDTGSTISTVLDRFASFPTTTTSSFAGSLPSTPTSIQKQLDLSYIINEFDDDDLFPVIDKRQSKSNTIEENNNIINSIADDNDQEEFEILQSAADQTDSPRNYILNQENNEIPIVAPRSRDINKQIINESENTLPRLVNFVPKKEFDDKVDVMKKQFENDDELDYEQGDYLKDQMMDYGGKNRGMEILNSKWIFSSHLSTIGEDEEDQKNIKTIKKFGLSFVSALPVGSPPKLPISPFQEDTHGNEDYINDKSAHMEVPPSGFRPPPDGHEFPDFLETPKQSYQDNIYKDHRKSEPIYQGLGVEKYLSSSNDDLARKMHEEDIVYTRPTNLLYTKSQSLMDMSVYSKEKLSSQRKGSKLKGLVIPESPEHESMPQVNIPEIKSITPLPTNIEAEIKENYQSVRTTPSPPVSSVILPTWTANTNLPKYSPAFKRKSLHVYPTIITKQNDSYSEESSYDEYISAPQSRHSDDLKSLESISSPTRSDYNFDYVTSKILIRDNKDHIDSDNDSAVSSSQSSFNSRSSPPPSYSSDEKFNSTEKIEAINRKNILSDAKCRSGQDTKTSVLQKINSIEERRNSKEETMQSKKDNQRQNVFANEEKNEKIVLKGVSDVPILVNEPVVLEVAVEQTILVKPNDNMTNNKIDNKPVPTKRTLAPTPTVKERKLVNELPEVRTNNYSNLRSESRYFDKQKTQASVQSLKANFEKTDSGPLLPKTPIAGLTTRRKSDDLLSTSNKDHYSIKQKYEETTFKTESRRPSIHKANGETDIIPKKEPRRSSINDTIAKIEKASSLVENRRSFIQNNVDNTERTPISKKDITKPSNLSITNNSSSASFRSEYVTVEMELKQGEGPLGVNIVGGIDQSDKNIMINRIRYGSVAYKDGRLKKGDKIVSINGEPCDAMTNADATALLKGNSTKFTIVIEESNDSLPFTPISKKSSSLLSLSSETKDSSISLEHIENKQPTHSVSIVKDGAGLGFSIEGGKDSPKGDVPLIIKKIFTGGVADKCGQLQVGDEIIAINGRNFQNLSRVDAWSQMKKMPDGPTKIDIFR